MWAEQSSMQGARHRTRQPRPRDVLPKNYNRLSNDTPRRCSRFSTAPMDIEGDAFGRICEYFLAEFARTWKDSAAANFYAYVGRASDCRNHRTVSRAILDPGVRIGGHVLWQSARFSAEHRQQDGGPRDVLSIYGQNASNQTVRLARMNLARAAGR